MKNLKDYINISESYNDLDLDEVISCIKEIAEEVLGNSYNKSKPEEILAASSEGEYTDYDKVAELLECDPDELCDFIDDNHDEIIKNLQN